MRRPRPYRVGVRGQGDCRGRPVRVGDWVAHWNGWRGGWGYAQVAEVTPISFRTMRWVDVEGGLLPWAAGFHPTHHFERLDGPPTVAFEIADLLEHD